MKTTFAAALFAAVASAAVTRTDTYSVTWATPFAGTKTGIASNVEYKAVYVQNSDKTVELDYTAVMNTSTGKRIAATGDDAEVGGCQLTATANKYDCFLGSLAADKATIGVKWYKAADTPTASAESNCASTPGGCVLKNWATTWTALTKCDAGVYTVATKALSATTCTTPAAVAQKASMEYDDATGTKLSVGLKVPQAAAADDAAAVKFLDDFKTNKASFYGVAYYKNAADSKQEAGIKKLTLVQATTPAGANALAVAVSAVALAAALF